MFLEEDINTRWFVWKIWRKEATCKKQVQMGGKCKRGLQ